MTRSTRSIGEYCKANPVQRHHQKAGEKVACSSPPISAGWGWNPDETTRKALARGQRKFRKFKAEKLEEAKMATTKAKGKKSTKKVTAKKVTAKKVTASNLTPLKKICQKLKLDPKMARRKLRAEGIKGHSAKARWEFTAVQAKKVTAILSA